MIEAINILNLLTVWKVLLFGSAFVSAFILVFQLVPDEKRAAAKKRLGMFDETSRPNQVALLKWLRPLYSKLTPWVASKISDDRRTSLHKKLVSANLREEITPDEFTAFKLVMTLVIPFMAVYITGALGSPLPPVGYLLLFVLGFYFPDLWMAERIRIRRRAIVKVLPYTLDLLTLSVESGLDFVTAIQRLGQRTKRNALLNEFDHMLREVRLGTSRSDALRNLSDRLQIEEMSSFTTLLVQADQLGAPIGQVLRAQSDQLRSKRFTDAEAAGARASQLILFPVIFCIFPAIVVVFLGPIALGFLQGGIF